MIAATPRSVMSESTAGATVLLSKTYGSSDLFDAVPHPPVGKLLGVEYLVAGSVLAGQAASVRTVNAPVRLIGLIFAEPVDLDGAELDLEVLLDPSLEDREPQL